MGRSDEVLRTTCSDAAADQQRDPSLLCTPVVHGPRPLGPGRWVERSAEGFLHVWDLDWTDGVAFRWPLVARCGEWTFFIHQAAAHEPPGGGRWLGQALKYSSLHDERG